MITSTAQESVISGKEVSVFKSTSKVVKNHYSVYLSTSVEDSDKYTSLINLLLYAEETDSFKFLLQNFGGSCHAGSVLTNAMKTCKSRISCEVIGPCYSAASIIALAGDELVIHPSGLLMFHNFSTACRGKEGEIQDYLNQASKWIRDWFIRVSTPFLTKAEWKSMIENNKDVYIHYDDPTLSSRIKRHFK